jgi:ketosteroid isomerase-like protein
MGADDNIKAIQAIYEAFGRGDVATILEALTDDVDWATDTSSTAAPWYGVRKGKAAVTAFFEAFGSAMEVEESRATGEVMDMNLHHYFVFRGSKIAFYRGTEDTVQTVAVLAG